VGLWTLSSEENFFPALVLAIVLFTNLTFYLFDINIQRHSVSVQSTCLPNIVYKLHREYQEYPRRLKARPVNRERLESKLPKGQ